MSDDDRTIYSLEAEIANWKRIAGEVTVIQHDQRLEIERLRAENAKFAMGLRAIIDDITGAELSKARAARAALEKMPYT